jgi:hypothetical protein
MKKFTVKEHSLGWLDAMMASSIASSYKVSVFAAPSTNWKVPAIPFPVI